MINMMDFNAAGQALQLLFSNWEPWLVVVPGMLIGLLFGAVPGLSTSMAMAIFLPATLYMDFLSAMLFLTAIFTGAGFGCAIPAILINIPGTSAAVATTFDGYPMAQRGEHNEALGLGLTASSVAEAISYILLFLLVEPISVAVLQLGATEMVVVALWGLTLIAALRDGNFARGLLAGVVGILLGTVGMNARGDLRGTLGSEYLLDGIPAVPALIAMFAAAELFNLMRKDYVVENPEARKVSFRRILKGVRQTFDYPTVLIRGSLVGVVIGAVPGVGSAVSNLMAYQEARRNAKDADTFGKGNPKGVVAAESANSSSEGGSMATLLALGIPGGGATAVMMAAFEMHNITGGPRFMQDHKDIVYAIIFGNFVQAMIIMVVGVALVYCAGTIVKVPVRVLVPSVMSLSIFGSYALTSSVAGPATLFVFSIVGWLMARYDYPVAATVVGLLLGRMTEGELLRSYQVSGGDFTFVFGRPITLVLIALLVLSSFGPLLIRRWKGRAEREQATEMAGRDG